MWVGAYYTLGEVLFLISLPRMEAEACDGAPPDSLARWTSGQNQDSGTSSDPELPVVVRWSDVRRVKRDVSAALRVRAAGVDLRTIAEANGTSKDTVQRKTTEEADRLLDQLGGAEPASTVVSIPPPCWTCGEREQATIPEVRVKRARGWQRVKAQRHLHGCIPCATATAVRLRDQGWTITDIAERMNLAPQTITAWLATPETAAA